ncbi:lipid-binding SYLF domain-containing protein [Pseudooceanicola sp. 502str34]|uniref:lipid-binding SYLF domain-containing protein n=1 Tax=Maritimibacter alkaliphilus TaxID=404236 RepID=UPI001C945853|nr:YSC84-related protein [Maritimibacter alkaliphilus]MBY6089371.1 twin-arginine translocation pathway signal [Maritimibacter alkaliphilus]
MSNLSRRTFSLSALAAIPLLAACNNGIGSPGGSKIDARVDATLAQLFSQYPETRNLAAKSAGMLVMPLMTEAGFGIGGGYGRGALRVGGSTVDYYSATAANFGLQIGAQQYAHVLFFMTQEALSGFRRSSGWAAGADVEYVFSDKAEAMRAETTTSIAPIVAVIFGQAGLRFGATLEGVKYSRILP